MSGKARIITLLAVALILGSVFGYDAVKQRAIADRLANFSPAPIAVTTETVSKQRWTTRLEAVGQVTAKSAVDVTTQIAGQVSTISFQSGDSVEEGQLLVQLDDRLLRDQLSRDEAEMKLAQLDVDRYSKLVKERSAAQSTLDRAAAQLASRAAAVHATATQIDYMAIKAPFPGQVGIRQVNVGDYLQPGVTVVNLQNPEVLFVDFSLPEVNLNLLKNGLAVELTSEAIPNKTLQAEIIGLSAQVDPNSRNIDVRAEVLKGQQGLVPGMFVDVSVVTEEQRQLVTLPAVAVAYSLYGDTVFVVGKPDGAQFGVERREVTVEGQRESKVGVSAGLEEGDQVITSNQHQLNSESRVKVNNKDVDFSKALPGGA